MTVYLVTYDLNKETVRPNIVGAIKKYDAYAQLSESSYAIVTEETPEDVYNKLKPLIDENDNIFIIQLRQPHSGFGPTNVIEWLQTHLPQ